MAGDTKTTDGREQVPAIDYADPFPGVQATLDDILSTLRGVAENAPAIFDILATGGIGSATHQWQRLHTASLVVSASAAGTAVLTVGSRARTWNIDVGVTTIPYLDTIERGTDISLSGTAVGITAYLIATPE